MYTRSLPFPGELLPTHVRFRRHLGCARLSWRLERIRGAKYRAKVHEGLEESSGKERAGVYPVNGPILVSSLFSELALLERLSLRTISIVTGSYKA